MPDFGPAGNRFYPVAALFRRFQVLHRAFHVTSCEAQVVGIEFVHHDVHVRPGDSIFLGQIAVLQVDHPEPEPVDPYLPGIEQVPHFFPDGAVLLPCPEEAGYIVPQRVYDKRERPVIHFDPSQMQPFLLQEALEGESSDYRAGTCQSVILADQTEIFDDQGIERFEMDPGELDTAIEPILERVGYLLGYECLHSWELDQKTIDQIWAETLLYVERGEKLYLNAAMELLAKQEQLNALETDEREGVIEDYLETPLPDKWNSMSLRDRQDFLHGEDSLVGDKLTGETRRETVCTLEIWCECLYRDRANLRRSDSNELTAILERLGWKRREKKERIPLYGMQYLFERGEASR